MALNLAEIFKDVPPSAAKYGVVGWPLSHTLSPAMHNAAINALGLKAAYRAIPVPPDEWKEFVIQAKMLPLHGFNITLPFKEVIFQDLKNWKADDMPYVRAANTISLLNGNWVPDNTDVEGFRDDLVSLNVSAKDEVVVVLGGGGAARAALSSFIVNCPRKVLIINRTRSKAEALATEFNEHENIFVAGGMEMGARVCAESALLVNATSIGLKEEDPSPVSADWLHSGLTVYDMIYHRETALLKAARAAGARAVGGLGMLVRQGARSFEIWFNRKPSIDVMRHAAEEELKRRQTT